MPPAADAKSEAMDVDKSADAPSTKEETSKKTIVKSVDAITVESIREHCRVIERSEAAKEPRQILRVLRHLQSTRTALNPNVLYDSIIDLCPTAGVKHGGQSTRQALLKIVKPHMSASSAPTEEAMEVDGSTTPAGSSKAVRRVTDASPLATGTALKMSKCTAVPEIEAYVHLLVLLWLLDQKQKEAAPLCLQSLVTRIELHNRRSMDALAAKAYYYYAIVRSDEPTTVTFLLGRLRMAVQRGDTETQATLINCVLGQYLRHSMYSDADKFFTKIKFPDDANNNEWARFVFYTGRIKAMQFEYQQAEQYLAQAIRKAPQRDTTAVGFKQLANKFHIVVTLLMGEIPERSIFRRATLKRSLVPYLKLSTAVRQGNLGRYLDILDAHKAYFEADGVVSLVARLQKNVVLTALKQISVVYSRIRLVDIQKKLQLESVNDVQCIVGNAIRDGVIDACVECESASITRDADRAWYMRTNEPVDVYSTVEPQQQFHTRTQFCLQLHSAVTKALRYPAATKETAANLEERLAVEQAEMELAAKIAEEEDEDDY